MADIQKTLFDLPNTPEEFGVSLPPSDLRKIDFSGLDFNTARRAIFEYIKTYYPNDFNDFSPNNGIVLFSEIIASVVAKLSLRADILHDETNIVTAKTEEAVINHLALINQKIKRQTPAVVDIEISIDRPINADVEIDAGLIFYANGSNNVKVPYEVYKSPSDWYSKIIIPAGKRGVIAYGLQGQFSSTVSASSNGSSNQKYTFSDINILESPILVNVQYGSVTENWAVTTDPIELYDSNDKVVEVLFIGDSITFKFGDNVNGAIPPVGSTITFKYRTGGGASGRIGVNQINETRPVVPNPPANSSINVNFRNITSSSGGADKETIEQAKKRAPRDYALHGSIVTGEDYAHVVQSYSHPAYGSVVKAVATFRSSLNSNLVELYVLAAGVDNRPSLPSVGLKEGLKTYVSDINVLTDYVVVLDGKIKAIDISANVIINRNADASIVKEKVEFAINEFFDVSNWEMGESFYLSNFIEKIESVSGVSYVDVLSPTSNILSKLDVDFNELIVLGNKNIKYFYANDR